MASFEDSGKAKTMTPFHRKVLTKAHPRVMESMVFTEVLRSHLFADEVLDLDESRNIRDKSGHNVQNSCLLELLHRRPDCAYSSFLKALSADNQEHVVEIIKGIEAELEQEEALRMTHRPNHQCVSSSSQVPNNRESHQATVIGADIASFNSNNAVALLGKPGLPREEVSYLDCRPKDQPILLGPQMSSDGSSSNQDKIVAIPRPLSEKERRFQEREKRKKDGRTTNAKQSPLASEGCMIGVKLFIRKICTHGNELYVPEESEQKAIENYIWTTLSQVLTKPLPEEISPELDTREEIRILRFLFSFQDYWCKVKHVGFEPVLFVVQCMTVDSLEKLLKADEEGTLAEQLEDAMKTETLARKLHIQDLMLETEISELEVKLANRILNKRVTILDVKMQSTPERHPQLECEWRGKVQTEIFADGTAINIASQAFRAKVREIKESSVLFTLQFYSKEDLNGFRENLVSGQLARLFENALITDEVKQKYGLDTLGLSLTMVDPWEYDMCEMELESATFDEDDEPCLEDESAEGKTMEPCSYCCEHVQTIEQLQMTNNQLREKCDELKQVVTQQEIQIAAHERCCLELLQTMEQLHFTNKELRQKCDALEHSKQQTQLERKQIQLGLESRLSVWPASSSVSPRLDKMMLTYLTYNEEEMRPQSPVPSFAGSADSGIQDPVVSEATDHMHDCSGGVLHSCKIVKYLYTEEPEVEEKQLDLRGYQTELAQPALDGKNVIVLAPSGSGKTHVALKIVQEHFRKSDPEQEPKVAFLVPTVELVRQQWAMFKTYIHDHKSVGISGDLLKKLPVGCLIHCYEIIILTPQILVDALKDKSVSSLSVFSLLLYDECHHAMKGHPYARVQYYYLTSKLQSPDQPTNLPQVVGLTASVGVGKKTRTLEGAVNHILKLCAHLDVEILKTVEKNRRELDKYENKPNEERKEVKGRVRDPFHDEVSRIMNIIETRIKRAPELRSLPDQHTAQQLAAPPGERGGERYTEWLGKLKKPVARIRDQDQRRFFHACTNHLEIYNCSLVVNADCRTVDALKVIEKKMLELKPEQEDDTDKWLSGMFSDHKDSLQQVADDPRNSNPKLEVVKRMIYEGYQKNPDNLRCIMFVKTREMTEALAKWINEDGELKHLAASSLAGKGPSTAKAGINQAQQKDVLQYFKDGKHKVIVATTVAEEGLDIQKCNLVIRYEHVTNAIAYVQARGRGRAEGADYYLVGGAGSGTVEREEINLMREQLMEKAIKKIREMKKKTFQSHINLYQQEIRREWMHTEARRNRRERRASDGDEDVYELRCIRCNHLACFSPDIRKVKDSHHVVTDLKMLEVVNIEHHPRPGTYDVFTKLGKLLCKECGEDWGIQVLYKGIKLPVIKISAFVVVFPNGARDNFKKWSQSPFDNDLAPLEDEELNEYNDELEELDLQ